MKDNEKEDKNDSVSWIVRAVNKANGTEGEDLIIEGDEEDPKSKPPQAHLIKGRGLSKTDLDFVDSILNIYNAAMERTGGDQSISAFEMVSHVTSFAYEAADKYHIEEGMDEKNGFHLACRIKMMENALKRMSFIILNSKKFKALGIE